MESVSMCRFVGIDLRPKPVPDETTTLEFRHLLENTIWGRGSSGRSTGIGSPRASRSVKGTQGRHHHQCPFIHQEQGGETRSGQASDQEGQSVVFWHEPLKGGKGPYRGR